VRADWRNEIRRRMLVKVRGCGQRDRRQLLSTLDRLIGNRAVDEEILAPVTGVAEHYA
jgi:hypothetical protein